MAIPDKETVRRVLAINDRGIACRRAVEQAWATVKASYAEKSWWRRKSTRAALVWEHSVHNAIAALAHDPGVRVVAHHDTNSFIFDDTVLLRFKKADVQLLSGNYPTLLARLFHSHGRDLFGHEGLHRVEIAHVLNRFQTELSWIGVVAREAKRVLWQLEFDSGGGTVVPLPLPDRSGPAADTVLRPVKPEKHEKRDDEIQ